MLSLAIFVIEPSGVVIIFEFSRSLYNVSNKYNSDSYYVNKDSSLSHGLTFAGYREVNNFFLAISNIFLYNIILIFFFEFNLLTGSEALSIVMLTAVAVIGTIVVAAAVITAATIIVAAVTVITAAIKRACVVAVAAATAIAITAAFTAARPAVLVARVIAFRSFISAAIRGIVVAASEVTARALASWVIVT